MSYETKLTPQQNAEIGRIMVRAAYSALGEYSDDLSQIDMTRRFIKGVQAASAEWQKARAAYGESPRDTEDRAAVTAFWIWVNQQEDVLHYDGLSADSQGAVWVMAVAQGLGAMRSIAEAFYLTNEEDVYQYTSTEIKYLSPMLEGGE